MSRRAERALALAGVFQAAELVHLVAWYGDCDTDAARASLSSVFHFDAPDAPAVFGGAEHMTTGLNALTRHLGGSAPAEDAPVVRYALGLLHLERRADATPGLWTRLHAGIVEAERQRDTYGIDHENTVAALAGLYGDLVSPAGPKIMVEGETAHLRDTRKAAFIRALLLAGIRAAVLWRQLGATRWSLLLGRRRMIADAEAWLAAS